MAAMALAWSIGLGRSAQATATVVLQEGSSTAYQFGQPGNLTFSTGTTYYVEESGNQTKVSTSNTGSFSNYDYSVKVNTLTDTVTSNPTTAELLQSSSDVSKIGVTSDSITLKISDTFTQPANTQVQLADARTSWSNFSESGLGFNDSITGTGTYTGTNAPSPLTENSGTLSPIFGPASGSVSSSSATFMDGSSFTLVNAITLNLGGDQGSVSTTNEVTLADPPTTSTPEPSTIALAIAGLGTMGLVHLRRRRAAKAAA